MDTREHCELFRFLMEKYCLLEEDIAFVESVSGWCAQAGIPEPEADRPLKLIRKEEGGCRLLVGESVTDEAIEKRLKALRIRNALFNVAYDRADMLDSGNKKLAYLFLSEYALSLPEIAYDELLADEWVFKEMENLEFFKGVLK